MEREESNVNSMKSFREVRETPLSTFIGSRSLICPESTEVVSAWLEPSIPHLDDIP
jgi:hypothetical protein